MILGIPDLLYHAFYNIVENAVKYNKDGDKLGFLPIKTKSSYRIRGSVYPLPTFSIFLNLYCVEPSRSRKLGGSGLGLSVVKAIIEKHDGKIHLESNIGAGTTITVEI